MKLRPAKIDDLPVLMAWNKNEQVLAAHGEDTPLDWERELPRQVSWRESLIAEEGETPIGVVIIIDPQLEETHYWGDIESNLRAIDIWIGDKCHLNQGFGSQMMKLALKRCFSHHEVKGVLVDPLASHTLAHRFYEKCGFEFQQRRFFGKDDCFVYFFSREKYQTIK